ncbi:hypothetical protein [Aquabacterium humicola]|uniref:hypothetical protein n=1 Tax=Aquabacterium humicola TaxID=3237377 RepID=UPI0025428623|nr:hypothetical protein [Rubrivivax pictus]
MPRRSAFAILSALLGVLLAALAPASHAAVSTPYPIVFVTQVPMPADFTTIGSTFGNHLPTMASVPRGGDLWIRYPDGTLRNLTAAAGLGSAGGLQGASAIAVRDPSPHWDGQKIVFAAVVGAPTQRYTEPATVWQLYEMSGLGANETPVVTKVANQPADYNNISPVYGSDDRIVFTSDRPRSGERHLWPQLDEYEEAPTVTGLWSLDPKTGSLTLLNHAPSGAFTPIIDSFGRVIFTRWDHLQRDQQADGDRAGQTDYGTFNYASEAANAARLADRSEVFPEPRQTVGQVSEHRFNQFFPWQINEDGTEEETLNHVGRQELASYGTQSFLDDANLRECCDSGTRFNRFRLNNDSLFHIKEDPTRPGRFVGTSAMEFGTHAAGQLAAIDGAPSVNPDRMSVTWLTAEATAFATEEGRTPDAAHSGLYRDPLPLSDGRLIASHTTETRADRNEGADGASISRYQFRLRLVTADGSGVHRAGEALTAGISKSVSWYDPDNLVTHSGALWELNPVELRPRARPARRSAALPAPEQRVFAEEGVNVAAFQDYLRQNNLALMVSRNVTLRDKADRQQPYNLRIKGGASTTGSSGKAYDVSHLQFVQGDQVRGLGGTANPRPGRRVLAQVMHEPKAANPFQGVPGAVALAPDGSVAALVPAQRAMSWQLTDGATPVVRERYWISFQKGEIRVCASCHGINQQSQAGSGEPQNPPEGLRRLLKLYKAGMTPAAEDRVFNWAERVYPNNFLPKNPATASGAGYTYRYYPSTDEYVGAKDGRVYYFKPGITPAPQDVGALQQFLDQAKNAGY